MDLVIFKVIFRAFEQYESKNLSLSFRNIILEKPIAIPSEVIFELKKLSDTNKNVISFQNIEEVILIGNPKSNYIFNYFLVILYTIKSNGKKLGYLVGNVKKLGDLIIGICPFTRKQETFSREEILENLNNIIKNLPDYGKICLISQ